MDDSKTGKRNSDDLNEKVVEPTLIKLDKHNSTCGDICIDKNEFKIGRGRDNDEIILDRSISRRHCIISCNGNNEWVLKDVSSTSTFINDKVVSLETAQKLCVGDTIQFGPLSTFRYQFKLVINEEQSVKKPKIEEQILDTVLTEQRAFSNNQECQKKELKNKLEIKQKEQTELKQQLSVLLKQQSAALEDRKDFRRQISQLQMQIEAGNAQEKHLETMYAELLEKLENERVQFEAKLNQEKKKWQDALDMTIQEKEAFETKMREQMERWRMQQQEEWKKMMEERVKEEKSIQAQLLNEKNILEEKLKETEKALKEREMKLKTPTPPLILNENLDQSCVLVEILNVDDTAEVQVIDTIDLTKCTENLDTPSTTDGMIKKVGNIMDEQLTCAICSELFVNATTLNCTHTFCEHCIKSWNKRRKECPVCRAPVRSMNRSLVLDNFIESMMENLPAQVKVRRKEVLQERQVLAKKRNKTSSLT